VSYEFHTYLKWVNVDNQEFIAEEEDGDEDD